MAVAQGTLAKVFNAVFIVIQLAGLGIAIAGVAILQNACNSNNSNFNFPDNPFGLGPNSARTLISYAQNKNQATLEKPTDYDCGMQLSWYWWVLALQLVCTSAGLLSNFIQALRRGKICIVSFFSTANALWCVFAYAMIWPAYLYQQWSMDEAKNNEWAHGYECGAVGAIITLAGNFMFMMVFGYEGADGADYEHKDAPAAQPAGFQAA